MSHKFRSIVIGVLFCLSTLVIYNMNLLYTAYSITTTGHHNDFIGTLEELKSLDHSSRTSLSYILKLLQYTKIDQYSRLRISRALIVMSKHQIKMMAESEKAIISNRIYAGKSTSIPFNGRVPQKDQMSVVQLEDIMLNVLHKVTKNETLWVLSAKYYKNPVFWSRIYEANRDKIDNPDLIYPGQLFLIHDNNRRLDRQFSNDGDYIHHVYQGQSIQEAIDSSSEGHVVYVHSGRYYEHVTLKESVNIVGEDQISTILHGNYQSGHHVISALGNNRIENLTISGSGKWAGSPSSAIQIKGNNSMVRNCMLYDNHNYGIYVKLGTDILIEKNFFKNNYLALQLPKTGNIIRYNTFINNGNSINVLKKAAPSILNNIIVNSTRNSIYEHPCCRALVKDNIFFNNTDNPGIYGNKKLPKDVENESNGNINADPQFLAKYNGNLYIKKGSLAYGKGAYLPYNLSAILDWASKFNMHYSITALKHSKNTIGYKLVYNDGTFKKTVKIMN